MPKSAERPISKAEGSGRAQEPGSGIRSGKDREAFKLHEHDELHEHKHGSHEHKHELNAHEIEHLLEHWIEHNRSHSESFRARAKEIELVSPKAAARVREAAELMDACTAKLEGAAGEV